METINTLVVIGIAGLAWLAYDLIIFRTVRTTIVETIMNKRRTVVISGGLLVLGSLIVFAVQPAKWTTDVAQRAFLKCQMEYPTLQQVTACVVLARRSYAD